jgi:hypothetical protein
MNIFAEAVLTDPSAQWLIAGLGAIAFLAIAGNAVFGILLKRKQLGAPAGSLINPQPLIVAMEKEFVHRAEYERRHTDVENQVREARIYSHEEIHGVRNELHGMNLKGEERDRMLHTLDERTRTHQRTIDGLHQKLDRVVERVGDKVEELLRNGMGLKKQQ